MKTNVQDIETASACPNNNVWCAGNHDQTGEFCTLISEINGVHVSVWSSEATPHEQGALDISVWGDEWDGDGSVKADSFEDAIAGVRRMIKDLQLAIEELHRIKDRIAAQ